METVEERVDSIEEIMKQLSLAQLNTEKELTRLSKSLEESHQRTEKELNSLSQEMKEFKDEMKGFKDEMTKSTKSLNKKWGELANRMGTVVEDIVAPNIPTIAQKHFQSEIEHLMIRTYKKSEDRIKGREFDVIAVCQDIVILNSTKTTASKSSIDEFADFIKSGEFYEYFPELKSKTLIPIFSSLSMHEDLVNYLTKLKIYALVMKGDNMDLVNFKKISKESS